jgi:hypothetical protein
MSLNSTFNVNIITNLTNIFNQISNSSIHKNETVNNLSPIHTNDHFNNEHSGHAEKVLTEKTLIAIIVLVVHTIAAPIFEKLHFHYIHESGISMLLGMIFGLFAYLISPAVKYFF